MPASKPPKIDEHLIVADVQVFDPGISGATHLPVRLEMTILNLPPEPTHTDLGGKFSRTHYKWLSRIFTDEPEWDDENPWHNAAFYNTSMHTEGIDPVIPVTVRWEDPEFGEDFYMTVPRAARMIRRLKREQQANYELLPDPTYARDKFHAWYIQHQSRACIHCANVQAYRDGTLVVRNLPIANDLFEIHPHRIAAVCSQHQEQYARDGHTLKYVV